MRYLKKSYFRIAIMAIGLAIFGLCGCGSRAEGVRVVEVHRDEGRIKYIETRSGSEVIARYIEQRNEHGELTGRLFLDQSLSVIYFDSFRDDGSVIRHRENGEVWLVIREKPSKETIDYSVLAAQERLRAQEASRVIGDLMNTTIAVAQMLSSR